MDDDLDRTDMGILYLLQRDARSTTTEEIGEQVGLAASTVSTRIRELEDAGIITDYRPTIDYQRAGFDQHLLIVGTVEADDREEVVTDLTDVAGVVNVRELLTEKENVLVELVNTSQEETERRVGELRDLGVEIVRTEFLKRELSQPFAHFGEQFTD